MAEMKINFTAGTGQITRTARIIAKHLTALADELEAPDAVILMPADLTEEQVAEFGERFRAHYGKGPGPDLCGHPTVLGGARNRCTRPAGHDPGLGHQVV